MAPFDKLVDSMSDARDPADSSSLMPRRTIVKWLAGAPLVLTFGLLYSPLLRFLKPTLKPLDVVGQSDQPQVAAPIATFIRKDFPVPWVCIPFRYFEKYVVYSAQHEEVRERYGFILRSAEDEIVAFDRTCTHCRHSQPVNYVTDTSEYDCIPQFGTPVFVCPCDCSTFDTATGKVLYGPARRGLRRMTISFQDGCYRVTGAEPWTIA